MLSWRGFALLPKPNLKSLWSGLLWWYVFFSVTKRSKHSKTIKNVPKLTKTLQNTPKLSWNEEKLPRKKPAKVHKYTQKYANQDFWPSTFCEIMWIGLESDCDGQKSAIFWLQLVFSDWIGKCFSEWIGWWQSWNLLLTGSSGPTFLWCTLVRLWTVVFQ